MNIRKIILCILMAAVMTASLSIAAGAATRADGFEDGAPTLEEMFVYGQGGSPDSLEIRQGEEIRIPLTMDMFTWADEYIPLTKQAVSVNRLRGVKVRARKVSGSSTLDYVQFDTDTFSGQPFVTTGLNRTGRTAYISVMFTREFISTEDQDFVYEVYLSIGKERSDDYKITLAGTMLVDLQEVDKGTDYVNLSDGMVIEATDYVSKVELDLGSGLSLTTNLFKDKRYYATCKIVDSQAEMKTELDYLPDLYPEIECIYKLETINVGAATRARIELPGAQGSVHHVYSEDLQYLGTTADELAFSPMFILCTQRVPALEEIDYANVTSQRAATAQAAEQNDQPEAEPVTWSPSYPQGNGES